MKREEFLNQLYSQSEGQIELRAILGEEVSRKFFNLDDHSGINSFCKTHSDKNLYYAVATRNGGGTKDHIKNIPAVWSDIDFKNTPEKTAKKNLKEFPLKP